MKNQAGCHPCCISYQQTHFHHPAVDLNLFSKQFVTVFNYYNESIFLSNISISTFIFKLL